VMAEAAANHAVLSNDFWNDDLEDEGPAGAAARASIGSRIVAAKEREFHTLGTVLGGCYEGSPIVEGDGTEAPAADSQHYIATSRPGCLAPHIWRTDGTSLYDSFGSGFALVRRPDATARDVQVAVAEAAEMNLPMEVVALSCDEAADRYPARLTLVRPDQHVAWRGGRWSSGTLRKVTGWGGATALRDTPVTKKAAGDKVIQMVNR
jgi:hypothetical protein